MIDISSNNEYFIISKEQLIRELIYIKNKFQFNTLQDCFGLKKCENISVHYQLFSKNLSKVFFYLSNIVILLLKVLLVYSQMLI